MVHPIAQGVAAIALALAGLVSLLAAERGHSVAFVLLYGCALLMGSVLVWAARQDDTA